MLDEGVARYFDVKYQGSHLGEDSRAEGRFLKRCVSWSLDRVRVAR